MTSETPRRTEAAVVLAPDSFKGTIGAADASAALARGWRGARPADVIVERPMADGGEGTLSAFERAVPGSRRMPVRVAAPDDRTVDASWLLLPGRTGVVELASTSGIELLDGLRPMRAHTRGFGQAIAAALDAGVERLVLCVGSSASTDGGLGMLSALGASFVGVDGRQVDTGAAGLQSLSAVELTRVRALPPGGVTVLTDVTNPLIGATGAAAVFGPQKGAGPTDIQRMDAGLGRLASLWPGVDPAAPGAGAAGGTGFALLAWGARLQPGAAAVAELIALPQAVAAASVVITGEGSFDSSSTGGKVPSLVAALAAASGVPAMLVAGRVADRGQGRAAGFAAEVSLTELAGSAAAAMADPARWLELAGRRSAERCDSMRLRSAKL